MRSEAETEAGAEPEAEGGSNLLDHVRDHLSHDLLDVRGGHGLRLRLRVHLLLRLRLRLRLIRAPATRPIL